MKRSGAGRKSVSEMPKLFQENLDLKAEDLVAGLLEACAIKEPPTDAQLVFDFLKLSRDTLSTTLLAKLSAARIDPKIRALLDIRERLVLVHPTFRVQRERFIWASLHEIGHYVIPDHRELLYKCSFQDLSYFAQRRLEIEANKFASDLIFQNDAFMKEAADYNLSMRVPILLRDRYRASFEAAIRRYVEKNPRPCALVVYRPLESEDFEPVLEVQYSARSQSWSHFAYIVPRQLSSADSPEHMVFYRKREDDEIIEAPFVAGRDERTAKVFPSELFCNTYKVFQLIHPPEDK